jgi:hypothetical protein
MFSKSNLTTASEVAEHLKSILVEVLENAVKTLVSDFVVTIRWKRF